MIYDLQHYFMNIKFQGKKIEIPCFFTINAVILAVFSSSIIFFPAIYAESAADTMPPIQSFGNFTCTMGVGHAFLTGYFNNENIPYKVIFLKMLVLDKNGQILSIGYGNISDVKPHEIKAFSAITRFSGNFSSCTVQVDSAIPK